MTLAKMDAAEKYATKHKWLNPYNSSKRELSFSETWLHIFQSSNSGELTVSKGRLILGNAYSKDYFVKKR